MLGEVFQYQKMPDLEKMAVQNAGGCIPDLDHFRGSCQRLAAEIKRLLSNVLKYRGLSTKALLHLVRAARPVKDTPLTLTKPWSCERTQTVLCTVGNQVCCLSKEAAESKRSMFFLSLASTVVLGCVSAEECQTLRADKSYRSLTHEFVRIGQLVQPW